jgi:hypothetical protein
LALVASSDTGTVQYVTEIERFTHGRLRYSADPAPELPEDCQPQDDGLHIVYGHLSGDNTRTPQLVALYDGDLLLAERVVGMPTQDSPVHPGMTRAHAAAEELATWAPLYTALHAHENATGALGFALHGTENLVAHHHQFDDQATWERLMAHARQAREHLPAARAALDQAQAHVLSILTHADLDTAPQEITTKLAAFRLENWRQTGADHDEPDKLVADARTAGISKHLIHTLTGIPRATIDNILD